MGLGKGLLFSCLFAKLGTFDVDERDSLSRKIILPGWC
jgi:hypothetical protein